MHHHAYSLKNYTPMKCHDISSAHQRIAPHIYRTPLLTSSLLNNFLGGHEITFKAECFQKIGAFKARGAINKLLTLQEQQNLPNHVVAFSAGNHSQAVAWAAKQFGIKATIFLPKIASPIKIQATKALGANVIITETRTEAEARTAALARDGAHLIHAFDDNAIIAGQGTATFEAIQDMNHLPDIIFTACGGGGLLAGSYLAKEQLSPSSQLYGVEPKNANDASKSFKSGNIYRLTDSPNTIADGVRTLALGERNFHYIKKINGFVEAEESEILYWTQWLTHLLKITIEPTAALAMAGAHKFLQSQNKPKRVLVILSGGNISTDTQQAIWAHDCLQTIPTLIKNTP